MQLQQSLMHNSVGPERRRHGRGSLHQVAGMNVLNLVGSFAEMGEQHGALLAEKVRRGPIPYYRTMVERLLGKPLGPLSPYLIAAIQRGVGSSVRKRLPPFALETIRGIARGAGLDEEEFILGCTMPDSLVWSASMMAKLRGAAPAVAHRLELGLGCTSAIAWGNATAGGKLLHARNFDYFGVENWVDNAALIFHTPEKGQRYVAVAAAGVGLGGITAMNEAGLTLTVHQHMFTDKARLGGIPIGVLGDRVMREASTLEQAAEILAQQRSIGCWTHLIADGKSRRVLCFEQNPERHVAKFVGGDSKASPEASTFGYANIYLDQALGNSEVALYGSYWRHNLGRHQRVNELLKANAGQLVPARMGAMLADQGASPSCRIRDSIAMVMTVGSVVFSPEDGAVWVGVGKAPTSCGEFIPFSFKDLGESRTLQRFTTKSAVDSGADAAFEQFRRAYVAYLDRNDTQAALGHMETALELAPKQAIYAYVAGLLSLELGRSQRAVLAFDRALALGHADEERVAAFHLWRGRALDLEGRRSEALNCYRYAIGLRADQAVRTAAVAGLTKQYNRRMASSIHVEMSLGDVAMP